MATNIELEKQIAALKAELDALKQSLRSIFNFRYLGEQPEIGNEWQRITKKVAEQENNR